MEKTVIPANGWLVLQLNVWENRAEQTEEKMFMMVPRNSGERTFLYR